MGTSPLICDCFKVIIFTFLGFGLCICSLVGPTQHLNLRETCGIIVSFKACLPVNIGTLTVPREPDSLGLSDLRPRTFLIRLGSVSGMRLVSDVLDLTCSSRIVS